MPCATGATAKGDQRIECQVCFKARSLHASSVLPLNIFCTSFAVVFGPASCGTDACLGLLHAPCCSLQAMPCLRYLSQGSAKCALLPCFGPGMRIHTRFLRFRMCRDPCGCPFCLSGGWCMRRHQADALCAVHACLFDLPQEACSCLQKHISMCVLDHALFLHYPRALLPYWVASCFMRHIYP